MIRAENLAFSYKKFKPLFTNLSFGLQPGSITGILGKNGEGKTTLMRLIAGMLLRKDGDLSVLGMDPSKRKLQFLQSVFVVPEVITTPKSSIESYYNMIAPFYPNYDEGLAMELLNIFQISPEMKLHQLSQGQQKKAVLSLAIALRTPILLMDEPTNGLDIPSKSAFRRIMAEHASEEQCIIISTHQVRDLDQIIDRIMILDSNKLVVNESIAELSRKFAFAPKAELPDRNPIYSEVVPLGEVGVYAAEEQDETVFSIELFFNAIVSAREQMMQVINSK